MPPWRARSSSSTAPSSPPTRPDPLPSSPSSSSIPPPRPVPSVPAPGLNIPTPPPPQPQPRTVKLTSSALLTLPRRLIHPPPVNNQVTSWGIVPTFKIELHDILERKHLPPLGLKDFEEWLLFVERSPQDLYFILWLREYTSRYNTWAQQSRQQQQILFSSAINTQSPLSIANPHVPSSSPSNHNNIATTTTSTTLNRHHSLTRNTPSKSSLFPSHPNKPFILPPPSPSQPSYVHSLPQPLTSPIPPSPPPSPDLDLHPPSPPRKTYYHPRYMMAMPLQPPASLALFYARAKETFLTPNGPYELLVSSDVLAIFHLTEGKPLAPPPDPAIFNELAGIVEQNLKDSLDRFVVATFNNVGTPRAHCGSVGGLSIGIAWSAPPLIASFTLGGARWWRLIALPGMWLGLTIFISAMYGVCMMIYVFGDLRQLRSFELSRPSISPPTPIPKPQEPAHIHNSPVRNVHRVAGNGQRERVGSISREMISGPFRIPQAITRPPKALVVSTRPSVGTIDSHQSGAGSQRSRGRVSQRSQVRSRSPSVDSESDASVASVSMADSASSIVYSDEESDDEGYAESDTSSAVRSKRKSRRAMSRRGSEATTTTTTRGGARRASRRPRIFISDAFYDEHPSPEGPATASFTMDGSGLVWSGVPTPGRHLVNAGAMRARGVAVASNSNGSGVAGSGGVVPGSTGGPPLWPDYAQNEEEEMNATATFIGRYVYEDNDFRFGNANCSWSLRSGSLEASSHSYSYSYSTSNRRPSGGGVSGSEKDCGDDLERGMGIGKSLTRMAVERQPVGVFDFDALPPPPMRRRTATISSGRSGDSGVQEEAPVPAMPSHVPTVPSHITTVPSHIAPVPQATPVSPIGTGKVHFGAGLDEEKGMMKEERVGVKRKVGWRERVLVYIQTKCGPGNVVSFHLRNVENAQQQGQSVQENGEQQLRSPISPLDEKTLGGGSNWGSPYSTLRKTPKPTAYPSHLAYSPSSPSIPSHPANPNQNSSYSYSYSYGRPRSNSITSSTWRDGFKKVSRVPAFASPLTPILNPVIGRAQWEIVARSALMSLVCCLIVIGGLLAVPEKA